MKRVSAVTHQYLARLEHALHEEDDAVEAAQGKGSEGAEGAEGSQGEKNPQGSSQSVRFLEMEKRAAEAEAALQVRS